MEAVENRVENHRESDEKIEQIDFKMVTFSLAGKDYGFDIMKVRDIAKDNVFTFVPNTPPYVRGVYNLRGEIISIIDLRIMFNLPAEKKNDKELENLIILRLEDYTIGVIVDSIDKIVGISSGSIQPSHPLFGDINIQYISGVVEHDQSLYIILDVERIFGKEEVEEKEFPPSYTHEAQEEKKSAAVSVLNGDNGGEQDFTFILETLSTFKSFHATDCNSNWVKSRFSEWKTIRSKNGGDLQLKTSEDAEEFLLTFYSPFTDDLLGEEYFLALKEMFRTAGEGTIHIWNPGCGNGKESFSLACFAKTLFPDLLVKIWAGDNDLMKISAASSLVFSGALPMPLYEPFLAETKNGFQFNTQIKDSILFEYHDILNDNPYPPADIIFCRDLLSFLEPEKQEKILTEFNEKLKPDGLLFLGVHENAYKEDWITCESNGLVAFRKENR